MSTPPQQVGGVETRRLRWPLPQPTLTIHPFANTDAAQHFPDETDDG